MYNGRVSFEALENGKMPRNPLNCALSGSPSNIIGVSLQGGGSGTPPPSPPLDELGGRG